MNSKKTNSVIIVCLVLFVVGVFFYNNVKQTKITYQANLEKTEYGPYYCSEYWSDPIDAEYAMFWDPRQPCQDAITQYTRARTAIQQQKAELRKENCCKICE